MTNPAAPASFRRHGGADAGGAARWDFSTCANAAGPCPGALAAVRLADPSRYPDPASTAVRQALAAWHGVAPWRVLPAASASEFIQRVTAVTGRLWPGAVRIPRLAYGDYAAAAAAWGRRTAVDAPADDHPGRDSGRTVREDTSDGHHEGDIEPACPPTLHWHADPSSPCGHASPPPANPGAHPSVLDAVYAPLRLTGHCDWTDAARDAVFVLHSPNKALGLTGVRGAYAVAPREAAGYDVRACCRALEAAAPSWPLSAQADAMLMCWPTPEVQDWVARSRPMLAAWKAELRQRLATRGFELQDSQTPYFIVRPPRPIDPAELRTHDVAVRDATSFGLPGWWRVSAQPPEAQEALLHALDRVGA